MMKHLKLFWIFCHFALKMVFQGRLGILFFSLGKFIRFTLLFLFIVFIYSKIPLLHGYTFQQIILFYMVFTLIDTLSQLLFREVYRFRHLVSSGGLDTILLKPYHPFIRILIGGIDILDALQLIPYLGICIYFILHIHASFMQILTSLLLFLNGLWIATSFHIIVLALGILTTEVDHTIMIYRDISNLGRFPISIYKEPITSVFTFLIPIGIMMTFPAQALFSFLQPPQLLYAFGIAILFFMFALSLWKFALTQYQSWGS